MWIGTALVTDDIVAFIRARLDEDELWAKAASAPHHSDAPTVEGGMHWRWAIGPNWEPYDPDPLEQHLAEDVDPRGNISLVTVEEWPYSWDTTVRSSPGRVLYTDDEVRTAEAAHIARHDPARVLREVEAKRAIVEMCESHANAQFPDFEGGYASAAEDALTHLALVWSDHPDYRPAWAPGAAGPA